MSVRVGEPILLAKSSAADCDEAAIAAANARIRAEFDRLYYGTGGMEAWMGPPVRDGKPLESVPPVAILATETGNRVSPHAPSPVRRVSIFRRGIGQVLWRCPVCHAEDAIWAGGRSLRKTSVSCAACGTCWALERHYEHDYRLRVTKGPEAIQGLEMSLSAWYDAMKCDFRPAARPANGAEWMPGEEVYLEAHDVSLLPYRPNPLFDGWREREAPKAQPHGHRELADWAKVGKGRLILTSHRLLWQGAGREVDFHWQATTAVYLWLQNTLGIRYGAAPYRLQLANEPGLKWLTYAGTLAKAAAAQAGRNLKTSDY